mmetsp:Transcript_1520/g.3054  ORF Transcript_1520/g.3054 Transcript_1520/m.3054 type:complete len:131 (-) Transcript_1520:11-403(-)
MRRAFAFALLSLEYSLEVLKCSNQTILELNEYSEEKYNEVAPDFVRYTRILKEAQADLSDVFRRIRTLRNRIKQAYPEACPETFDDDLLPEEKEELLEQRQLRQDHQLDEASLDSRSSSDSVQESKPEDL